MQEREYIKNLKSFSNFLQDLDSDRLFHAIMLINPDSEFLKTYSNLLAGEILARGSSDRERAIAKVEKEIHPDLFVYGKDKPIDASIAKDIASGVFVAPYEGDRKVYIIDKFDEIMPAGANKLLKTIEEPPTGVTFILLVRNDSRVLQTLLSRSQKFYLEGYGLEQVASILKAKQVKDYDVISLESGGNLTDAIKLAGNKNSAKIATFVLDTLEDFRITTQLARFTMMAEEFKETLPELMSFFSVICSLAIHVRAGKEISCTSEMRIAVNRIARIWNYRGLVSVIDASIEALKKIESFVSTSNVIDQFLLKILEIRRKCRV